MHLQTDLSETASNFRPCSIPAENIWSPFYICFCTIESEMLTLRKCGLAEINVLLGKFFWSKVKLLNTNEANLCTTFLLLFSWSDAISLVFLIWAESPRRENNHHLFVSVRCGICLSKESGHRTRRPWVFSAEELCFPEYVPNCMNKSLSDTSEQEERSIQKFSDLCYKGG